MLPKKHRLPLRTDLVHVQEKGKIFQGKLFSLLISRQESVDRSQPSRFGFIISTKIHKRATKRNRARRLLIEAIRPFLSEIRPGFDVIFLAKKAIVEKQLVEIKKEVEKLFKKSKLT